MNFSSTPTIFSRPGGVPEGGGAAALGAELVGLDDGSGIGNGNEEPI
jgi:hypothetical protein